MIKRIKYISRHARHMTTADIGNIEEVSARNNAAQDITGIFMSSGGLFYQVLEGPEVAVDALLTKIARDDRHVDLVVLGEPQMAEHRLFPDWAMRKFDPADTSAERAGPLHALLSVMGANRSENIELASVLERGVWRLMRD